MKKLLALLLVVILCFSMTGCSTIAVLAFNSAVDQVQEELSAIEEESPLMREEEAGTVTEEIPEAYVEEPVPDVPAEESTDTLPEESTADSSVPAAEPAMPENPTVEDLVYTAHEVPLRGTDSAGNTYDVVYRVPAFAIDNEAAREVNDHLEVWLLPYIEDQLENHEAGYSITISTLDYEAWIYDNILTVVIYVHTDWSQSYYQVYSVDIHTGEFLDNEDILEKIGFDEETIRDTVIGAITEMYDPSAKEMAGAELFEKQLKRTLAEENLAKATFFFSESGILCMHITICPLAGPNTYEIILELPIG